MSEHVLDQIDVLTDESPARHLAGFSAEADRSDGTQVFRLRGELDMATAPRLARALSTALDAGPTRLAIDLRDLTFIDSAGVRVVLAAGRRARDAGAPLVLRSPCRSVRKVLRLTGADRMLVIELGAATD